MLCGSLILVGCGGPKPESDSPGDSDSAADTSPAPFECGVTVPEGLRLVAAAQTKSGDGCPRGLAQELLTSATGLDAFVAAREACASSFGADGVSEAVAWSSEFVLAATATHTQYGWRLGAVRASGAGTVTEIDWCVWHPAFEADTYGTYLAVYAIPNDWPTELESTVTVYDEEP